MVRLLPALKGIGCAVALAAGVWTGGSAIRALRSFPEVPGLTQKYRFFQAHRDEYDGLFVGSSRLYHQIVPAEFDREVAAAGGPRLRTFNAGFDALQPPESFLWLRRLLALHPRRLRWVFLEAMEVTPWLHDWQTPTQRETWWHDARHTRLALARTAAFQVRPIAWRMAEARAHLFLFARYLTNFGAAALPVQRWLNPRGLPAETEPDWSGKEGFAGLAPRSFTDAQAEDYRKQMAELRGTPRDRELEEPYRTALRELIREIRAAGAEPVLISTPTLDRTEFWREMPEGVRYYSFADAATWPELYDPAVHYDASHLSEPGAHLFTRLLAERFARDQSSARTSSSETSRK